MQNGRRGIQLPRRPFSCRVMASITWSGMRCREGGPRRLLIFHQETAEQDLGISEMLLAWRQFLFPADASITNTVRYTAISPEPFKDIWR
jgi:hypothetical protein